MRRIKRCDPSPRMYAWIRSSNKIKQFMGDFVYGLQSNIPVCCVIAYCIERTLFPEHRVAQRRGCMAYTCEWAHCPVCAWLAHVEKNLKNPLDKLVDRVYNLDHA